MLRLKALGRSYYHFFLFFCILSKSFYRKEKTLPLNPHFLGNYQSLFLHIIFAFFTNIFFLIYVRKLIIYIIYDNIFTNFKNLKNRQCFKNSTKKSQRSFFFFKCFSYTDLLAHFFYRISRVFCIFRNILYQKYLVYT